MTCPWDLMHYTVHKVSWLIVHIRAQEQNGRMSPNWGAAWRLYLLPNVFTVFKWLKITSFITTTEQVAADGLGGLMASTSIKICAASRAPVSPPDPSCFLLFGPELQEYHGNIKWSPRGGDPSLVSSIKPLFTWGKVPRGPSDAANLSRLNWKSPSGRCSSQVTGDWHDASPARHELIHRTSRANGRIQLSNPILYSLLSNYCGHINCMLNMLFYNFLQF